jgi:S-methylmethionine-dependent homocysteine/selenocysteine methylase
LPEEKPELPEEPLLVWEYYRNYLMTTMHFLTSETWQLSSTFHSRQLVQEKIYITYKTSLWLIRGFRGGGVGGVDIGKIKPVRKAATKHPDTLTWEAQR